MNAGYKTNAPIFSVIIPAYNAEKFIHNAIKSVQQQSLNEWEMIIVENGSTDNTNAICERFLTDERIKLLHSEKGVSLARNVGINAAVGKWLIFLDADDQLLSDTLQNYFEIDDEYSPDMIIGEYEDRNVTYTYTKKMYQDKNINDFLSISLENPTQKCTSTAVAFRTSVIQQGIFFDPLIRYAEDSVFFIEALNRSKKVISYLAPVYRVIYNSQSTVRSAKRKLDMEYIPAINRLHTILNISNPAIKNGWYIFTLNQILVIFVNDIFYRRESASMQIKDARELMKIPEYENAIENADISGVTGMKKIVFKMMKNKFMLGILLAVRVKQQQNKKREQEAYV